MKGPNRSHYRTADCARVPVLIEQTDRRVASVLADGAYDAAAVCEAAQVKGEGQPVRVLIPPGPDAQLAPRPSTALEERNRNILSIRFIRELGRREWHRRSGYSTRSPVEITMYRYEAIIGRSMRSRTFDGQRVEVRLARKIFNTMTRLGCRTATAWIDLRSGDGGLAPFFEPCNNALRMSPRVAEELVLMESTPADADGVAEVGTGS